MAIAYGYNNIKRSQPPTLTIGSEQPVNQLSDMLRAQIEVCRTSLLPGILKTFRENKHVPYAKGVKLFEVSDVVLKDPKNYVGARNERRLCAVYMGQAAQIEVGASGSCEL